MLLLPFPLFPTPAYALSLSHSWRSGVPHKTPLFQKPVKFPLLQFFSRDWFQQPSLLRGLHTGVDIFCTHKPQQLSFIKTAVLSTIAISHVFADTGIPNHAPPFMCMYVCFRVSRVPSFNNVSNTGLCCVVVVTVFLSSLRLHTSFQFSTLRS